jgi:anaerobic selenocysteine-containing dehydrogenase
MSTTMNQEWKPSACILCECNCGVEIRLGPDQRTFERVRGDKAHPGSKGYTCEKALRLNWYQNGRGERVTEPMRRLPNGEYEAVDWETAIREIADRLGAIRDQHGGERILYYGGGGQGNHLGGAYAGATLRAFGAHYRSNALAQEKTGEFWVNSQMLGRHVRSDFAHAEVAVFVGKNPWHTHGFPHARTTLKEISNDPQRSMIVIDPRRTETAELADFHLQVKPGRDAWLISALVAVIVQEQLYDRAFVEAHTDGFDTIDAAFGAIDIERYAAISGVDVDLIRAAARRIASAASVAMTEDLGIQMNRHSTMVSWAEKLIWALTGNFGKPGTQYAPSALAPIAKVDRLGHTPTSPVTGSRIVSGLIPCNALADEILTDHPDRFRAMIVETANPAHSLADSARIRQAIEALDLVVVIDVFMSETARLADYVLPARTQFEKPEATFFNFEFPENVFQLRRPVVDPIPGPLAEPEIHSRLVEATGVLDGAPIGELREAAERDRAEFAGAFLGLMAERPELAAFAPVILYRTLGAALPADLASAAVLWAAAHRCVQANPRGCANAGFGEGLEAGERLFDAILDSPSGVVFTVDEWDESWTRLGTPDGSIQLVIDPLLEELKGLDSEVPPGGDAQWPFLLSAGERRSFTANTIIRDPGWRKRDAAGAMRMCPADATAIGVESGGRLLLTTPAGEAVVTVELDESMQPGHAALPNGMGLDHLDGSTRSSTGVAPNELTSSTHCDPWVGTPWHKTVPARLEIV